MDINKDAMGEAIGRIGCGAVIVAAIALIISAIL
jgi:hypothetical protein